MHMKERLSFDYSTRNDNTPNDGKLTVTLCLTSTRYYDAVPKFEDEGRRRRYEDKLHQELLAELAEELAEELAKSAGL